MTIWLVDDLPSNRDRFLREHGHAFNIRVFDSPTSILEALDAERPDAVLCDIYFFPDQRSAESAELKVHEKAEDLESLGNEIGAAKHQAGVDLIEQIFKRHDGAPPFPVYAYTSKGPYLLQTAGFERIAKTGAKWLFKGKTGAVTEQTIIARDIAEWKAARGWRRRFAKNAGKWLSATGISGAFISWLLCHFLG